jgi:hypothetical protein
VVTVCSIGFSMHHFSLGFICLDIGFAMRSAGFTPGKLYADFVVDEVVLEQFSSKFLNFSLLIITPLLLHTHLSPSADVCRSHDREHIITFLVFKFCAAPLALYLSGYNAIPGLLKRTHKYMGPPPPPPGPAP